MIILIDAYNLLKTVLHSKFVENKERTYFLNLFEKYAAMRGHQIILVFDGETNIHEYIDDYTLITIYYSGYQESADDLIKKKLKLFQGKDVLLVTSDRDIRQFAKQCLIESIASQEFYTILQNVMRHKDEQKVVIAQTIQKTTTVDNPELDLLMEVGSRQLLCKEQDKLMRVVVQHDFKKNNCKKDKKLLKKIVKI